VRIALCDDDPAFRTLIRLVLEPEPDIEVVAEFGDGRSCVDRIGDVRPDAVLVDLTMPVMSGYDTIPALLSETKVVVLSSERRSDVERRVLALGAQAFVEKDGRHLVDELASCLRTVVADR
jgi:DNA-binding NarL/FixJ family response regulator